MPNEPPERSTLRVRERPHIDPRRNGEMVVEVLRDGEVVAHVYGSREGVHVVSPRIREGKGARFFQADNHPASIIVPLLREEDGCPWCMSVLPGLTCPWCGEAR